MKNNSDEINSEEEIEEKNEPERNEIVTLGPGEHPLQYTYTFWFSKRTPGKSTQQSYDQDLIKLGSFVSVEQFWKYYSHLKRPGELGSQVIYHLFKQGIRPMWEDQTNLQGGKWMLRLNKGQASRCWENLILAMLGEQFVVGDELCGAVISMRFQEDILSLWNRTSDDLATVTRMKETMKRVLNLPPNVTMEYKTHNVQIKKKVPK